MRRLRFLLLASLAALLLTAGCEPAQSQPPAAGAAESSASAPAPAGPAAPVPPSTETAEAAGQPAPQAAEAPAGSVPAGSGSAGSVPAGSPAKADSPLPDVDDLLAAAAGTELKILQFLPSGQVAKLSQIAVMFNQPMVALGEYDSVNQDLMTLDPPIRGTLRWLNQYTLAFLPEEPYTGSLELTATLKGGLKSLTGQVLDQPVSVDLVLPAVSAQVPEYFDPFNPDSPLQPIHLVVFNQIVDPAGLNRLGFFVDAGSDSGSFSVPAIFKAYDEERDDGLSYAVRPAEPLPPDSAYRLVIRPGLVSKAGPQPTQEELFVLESRTFGPLKAGFGFRPDPDTGLTSPGAFIQIEFSSPVRLADVLPFIESDPPIPELDHLKRRYQDQLDRRAARAAAQASAAKATGGQASGAEAPAAEARPAGDSSSGQSGAAASDASASDSATAPDASASPGEPAPGLAENASAPEGLDDDPEIDIEDFSRNVYLYPRLKAETAYRITVKAGAADVLGQKLASDAAGDLRTGSYEPEAYIIAPTGLMETGTAPVAELMVTNKPRVIIEGYALPLDKGPEYLRVLGSYDFTYRTYADDLPAALAFLRRHASYGTLAVDPPGGAVDGPVKTPFSLAKLFGGDLAGRILVLHIQGDKEPYFSHYQVSDLAMTLKIARGSGLAWVTDLRTGQGVAGAEVVLLSSFGDRLFEGATGPDGTVVLPGGEALADILGADSQAAKAMAESDQLYAVATHEGRGLLWSLAWNDGFEPWRFELGGGYESPFTLNPGRGFLIASQPIYRPGSLVRLKLVARQSAGDEVEDFASMPVKVYVSDGYSQIYSETVVQTGPFGTASIDHQLPPDSPPGSYFVHLSTRVDESIAPGNLGYGSSAFYLGSFEVQNFRNPPFKLDFDPLPAAAYDGDELPVRVQALYHFGSPLTERPATWSVDAWSAPDFRIAGLAGFSLTSSMTFISGDSDDGGEDDFPVEVLAKGEAVTGPDGRIAFGLKLEPERRPRPRRLSLNVSATDVDGREIHSTASVLAHPASIYPAMRARASLVAAGDPMEIDLAAASPDGALHPAEAVVTLYRRSWNTVRRRGMGNSFLYDSKPFDEKVLERSVATSGAVATIELAPPAAGYYWAKASLRDDKGRLNESTVSFYAHGPQPVGWRLDTGETLTLIPDRAEYAPGDTARILVQSPFQKGQAMVAIERASIREVQIFDLDSQSPVVEVPIGPDDGPNIYVSVILSRGRIAEKPDAKGVDLGKPAVRKGYLTLSVPTKADLLAVEVKSGREAYSPGEEVAVEISVTDSAGNPFAEAEVALIAVDAALVQLAGDDNYFPDKIFSQLRSLQVKTSNSVENLLGRRNWEGKGGLGQDAGGGGEYPAPYSSGDVRGNFLDLAHFDPAVALSDAGTARAVFTLPDNLTTFRIYAVATGHGRVSGTGEASVVSTKDLLVRSSLPAHVSVGDEFAASVIVTNRLERSGQAKVTLAAEGLDSPAAEALAEIGPNQSLEVPFRVSAPAAGEASLHFSVSMGDLSDEAVFKLPVLPHNRPTTQASYLQLEPGLLSVPLAVSADSDPARGGLDLELSPTLVGVLSGAFQWLADYPYQCLEQSTSKAFGDLLRLRLQNRMIWDDGAQEAAKARVAKQIALLADSQRGGAFTLWPDSSYSQVSPALTAFALEFLLEARSQGFEVTDYLTDSAAEYLSNLLGDPERFGPAGRDLSQTVLLYATQVLARSGAQVEAFIETRYRAADTLSLPELLHLTRAVGLQPKSAIRSERLVALLPKIANHLELTAGRASIPGPAGQSPYDRSLWFDADKLLALTALTFAETAPHNPILPGLVRTLADRSARGHLSTTQANVLSLWAMAVHLDQTEAEDPRLAVKATLGDAPPILEARVISFTQAPLSVFVPLSDLSGAGALDIEATGVGQAWATAKLTQAPLAPILEPESAGLVLSRSYTVVSGPPSPPGKTVFRRGQVVRVDVMVMTTDDRYDVALEDRVPAGFEPINFNLLTEDRRLLSELRDEDGSTYGLFGHEQIWPDHVAVFADRLPAGSYTWSYLVRPATPGTYRTPGPTAQLMYEPETFGRGRGHVIEVAAD